MPSAAAFIGARHEEPSANSRYEQAPAPATRYEERSTVASSTVEPTRSAANNKAEQPSKVSQLEERPRESRKTEYEALGAGATATGAAALAYKAADFNKDHTHAKGVSSTTAPTSDKRVSSANHDQYNHLASGTPSGMNLDRE